MWKTLSQDSAWQRRTSRPSQLRSSRLFNGFADNVDFFQIRKGTDFGHLMHVRIYHLLVAVCIRVFTWKRRLWCRRHARVHMVIQMLYREQLLSMVRGAIVKESKARKILPKVGFENFLKQALYDFEVWNTRWRCKHSLITIESSVHFWIVFAVACVVCWHLLF